MAESQRVTDGRGIDPDQIDPEQIEFRDEDIHRTNPTTALREDEWDNEYHYYIITKEPNGYTVDIVDHSVFEDKIDGKTEADGTILLGHISEEILDEWIVEHDVDVDPRELFIRSLKITPNPVFPDIPEWNYRAIDLEQNAGLTWHQAQIVAMLESGRFIEQREIAEKLDITPQAVSDVKNKIETKIEETQYLKESSPLF
jgi:hypothetical protein